MTSTATLPHEVVVRKGDYLHDALTLVRVLREVEGGYVVEDCSSNDDRFITSAGLAEYEKVTPSG